MKAALPEHVMDRAAADAVVRLPDESLETQPHLEPVAALESHERKGLYEALGERSRWRSPGWFEACE